MLPQAFVLGVAERGSLDAHRPRPVVEVERAVAGRTAAGCASAAVAAASTTVPATPAVPAARRAATLLSPGTRVARGGARDAGVKAANTQPARCGVPHRRISQFLAMGL